MPVSINNVALYHQIGWLIKNNFLINLSLITRTVSKWHLRHTSENLAREKKMKKNHSIKKHFSGNIWQIKISTISINTANLIALNLKTHTAKILSKTSGDLSAILMKKCRKFSLMVEFYKQKKEGEASCGASEAIGSLFAFK